MKIAKNASEAGNVSHAKNMEEHAVSKEAASAAQLASRRAARQHHHA